MEPTTLDQVLKWAMIVAVSVSALMGQIEYAIFGVLVLIWGRLGGNV